MLLASLSETLSDLFANHYSTFMPGLMSILQNTPSNDQKQKDLKASCISAMGTLFESMKNKPEICGQDAKSIMASFASIMTQMA